MKRIILLCSLMATLLTPNVKAQHYSGNPILAGYHADPDIVYSPETQRYYIYSTTDGLPGWDGWYLTCFSSADLTRWRYEGVALNVLRDTKWAKGNAWAPAIEEKDGTYYLYYSGEAGHGKAIGVATSKSPTGPFKDLGHPIVDSRPQGVRGGQQIDVDVFTDKDTGKSYLYWGNGYMAGAELNPDMTSLKEGTTVVLTPKGGTLKDYAYREGPYVFKRQGTYYFMWSVDDTGSPNYHVAYGTSDSPLGPIHVAENPIVLQQDPANGIYGTAHNSVLNVPGTDDWYIVYHRIDKNYLKNAPGVHRQVCIDRLYFNNDGTIKATVPTQRGVRSLR